MPGVEHTMVHVVGVTDAYTVLQADDLCEPLRRGRGARAGQIRPMCKVRAVPKSPSQ
jgi:hypothetical protein